MNKFKLVVCFKCIFFVFSCSKFHLKQKLKKVSLSSNISGRKSDEEERKFFNEVLSITNTLTFDDKKNFTEILKKLEKTTELPTEKFFNFLKKRSEFHVLLFDKERVYIPRKELKNILDKNEKNNDLFEKTIDESNLDQNLKAKFKIFLHKKQFIFPKGGQTRSEDIRNYFENRLDFLTLESLSLRTRKTKQIKITYKGVLEFIDNFEKKIESQS